MMIAANQIKVPVDPQRILTMPRQFGPLDRRRFYEKHIRLMALEQIALYVFLVCVSDVQGLSFYSAERVCRELPMSLNGLWGAREGLIDRGLLLSQSPPHLPTAQPSPSQE